MGEGEGEDTLRRRVKVVFVVIETASSPFIVRSRVFQFLPLSLSSLVSFSFSLLSSLSFDLSFPFFFHYSSFTGASENKK